MTEQGRRISDRYELVSLLGQGGMGVVWRARDTRLQRAVAVKLLSAASVGSEVARTRLIREARAAAALEHEGIIRVYDVDEIDDGGAFLVMELIRGRSLRQALEDATLSLARRVEVIVRAARALAFAHAAGIVHRDVKPDNIMLRDDGRVILVDFGVAKPVATELLTHAETVAGITEKSLTVAGQLVGTPAYLAPEQARGAEVSAATDQFALAVTAYEALTGRLPWTGKGVVEIVASILRDAPAPIDPSRGVPAALEACFGRALAKEAADRFPDTGAFADAFAAAAASLPPDPKSLPVRAASPAAASVSAPAPEQSTHSGHAAAARSELSAGPAPRRRWPLAAMVVVGVLAAGGWFWSRAHSATPGDRGVPPAAAGATVDAIACPQLEVGSGQDPWLGAPAAALACDRFGLSRGGLDGVTLVPAELAGAPMEVAPGFPPSLLDASRERAIAAAKERAPRWLDGQIDKQLAGYTIHLVLRSRDGTEQRRGDGHAIEMFEAVREAMKPILRAEPALTPTELASAREWLDVSTIDESLELLDVRTSILIEDPISLREACAAVERRPTFLPRVKYLVKVLCARKLRTGKIEEPPPPVDDSSPAALLTTTLAQGTTGGPSAVKERARLLEERREKTTSPEGQARLSAAAAELYHLIGDPHARQLARMAIQFSSKGFDWRTSAWHRLAFTSEGDMGLSSAVAAWHPWEPISQSMRADRGQLADPVMMHKYVERSYLLAQRGYYAGGYGELLISQGNLESARGIAERTGDELLRVKILNGQAQFGAALAAVPRLIEELPATEANAALAFQLAHEGVRAALTLEKPTDFVETVVARYVMSEPNHVVDGVVPFLSLVTSCCFAPKSTATRCVARLQSLRAAGQIPTIFTNADTVINGAQRFVADDFVGATKIWRTLLRAPGWIQDPIRESMARAFEKAGENELAEEVDSVALSLIDRPRTAELAWVRGAKRAFARGDKERAKKLAHAVVDKWRFADEDIPAMREMRQLLAKLPP